MRIHSNMTEKVKTRDSNRRINICKTLINLLEIHKKRQDDYKSIFGDSYIDNWYVCCEHDGKLVKNNI